MGRLDEIRARLEGARSDQNNQFLAVMAFSQHAPADIAYLLDQLALAEACVAATERYLDLSSECDYADGEPDVCPGGAQCYCRTIREREAPWRRVCEGIDKRESERT